MKLAIFGATGPLGLQLVQQALDRGHHVRAIVRNPQKLTEAIPVNERLEIIEGDITSESSIETSLSGCEVVLSALGSLPSFRPITLLGDFCKVLVPVMTKLQLNRLVVCTAQCTKADPKNPFFLEWVFKPLVIGRNMDDFQRMEEDLEQNCPADINYTVVKPPHLINGPLLEAGKCKATEGQMVANGRAMPRSNVAYFMLDCLETDVWDRKLVAVAM